MYIRKQEPGLYRRVLVFIFVIFFAVGVGGLIKVLLPNPSSPPRYPPNVITNSDNTPSEEPVSSGFVSTAIGDEPASLTIPSIAVSAPIQKVGIGSNGEIAVPNNIHVVGWFVDGVKPGETGLSILDGHFGGTREKGIFEDLAKIAPGEIVTVERADKSQLHFEVFEKRTVKTKEASNILFSQNPTIKSQLNLITCAGVYDNRSRNYDQRVIVSARLLPYLSLQVFKRNTSLL